MGKLLFQAQVCILICWALMLTYASAERQYFIQSTNVTWEEARNHCQMCFKELVTLTPENIQIIAQRIDYDHWIGLRKNYNSKSNSTSNSTSNPTRPWTRWANGDPLAFQNWYPGWPVFKSPFPKRDCCSCSCTCPAPKALSGTSVLSRFSTTQSSSPNLTTGNITADRSLPLEATCSRSPMPMPDVPDPDENYIEDSCVAMLIFGPWIEKECFERLPFICYEDRFFGQVNVTGITTENATLTWEVGPGDINHYRVEVKGDTQPPKNLTNLTLDLVNLTAGTRYSVQVFPVKCERDLNPQNATFYTTPNKVINLTVSGVKETSVFLSWNKSAGNRDFYLVKVEDRQINVTTESTEISDLIPGGFYKFTVLSGVEDNSTRSEESFITVYTKPGKVSDLNVSYDKETLSFTWKPPEGNYTGFMVMVFSDSQHLMGNLSKVVNETSWRVHQDNLTPGAMVTFTVAALANHTLEGDTVNISTSTAPGPVSNLMLEPTANTLSAKWTPPTGSFTCFSVKLFLDGDLQVNESVKAEKHEANFTGLKTAANYSVEVYTVSGKRKSVPVKANKFTLPTPPTDARNITVTKTSIRFDWKPPNNTATVTYSVKLNSSFWNHNCSEIVSNRTEFEFSNLKSGTLYSFEVRTEAGNLTSEPARASARTETDETEISLSMLCSSVTPLLCDGETTRERVWNQLEERFNMEVGDAVHWKLENPPASS